MKYRVEIFIDNEWHRWSTHLTQEPATRRSEGNMKIGLWIPIMGGIITIPYVINTSNYIALIWIINTIVCCFTLMRAD